MASFPAPVHRRNHKDEDKLQISAELILRLNLKTMKDSSLEVLCPNERPIPRRALPVSDWAYPCQFESSEIKEPMKKRYLKQLLLLIPLVFGSLGLWAQPGIIINEVSNGPGGTQEYFELVVIDSAGKSCGTVDLRGWIFDDNNGDFSCGPRSGAGIAQGHARFSSSGPWGAIPSGAIILLYNDDPTLGNNPLVPAADPYDANGDSVYVIPASNTHIEFAADLQNCSGRRPVGCGSTCPGIGISSYTPSTYSFGGSWAGIGLRNSGGDAAQTRDAAGNYFHGLSYGGSTMTGGPDNLKIATSNGSSRVYSFDSGDFRDVANFSMGSAGINETPGAPNSSSNQAFIDQFRCNTLLPVIYSQELTAVPEKKHIDLYWATAEEVNAAYFSVQRGPGPYGPFTVLGKVTSSGSVNKSATYQFVDENPIHGMNYYRLRQVDEDGRFAWSNLAEAEIDLSRYASVTVFPNPAATEISFSFRAVEQGTLQIFDLQGKLLTVKEVRDSQTLQMDLNGFQNGMYIYRLLNKSEALTGRFVVSK